MDQLRCPSCQSRIAVLNNTFFCEDPVCAKAFPIVNGIPVLINEENSVFAIDDFVSEPKSALGGARPINRLHAFEQRLWASLPKTSRNLRAEENLAEFAEMILTQTPIDPQVLVLGAGPEPGEGLQSLVSAPGINLVETDVAFGPTTALVCDAHDIPFVDESFDAVVVQAVLEHVADPYRCAGEIHRVLKPNGLVYAETPFMQQVHMGPYDFTRFTHLGHRRLFRRFSEIRSGIACGPGMALAWSYRYFLISFARSHTLRGVLKVFARLTSFILRYLDPYVAENPAAFDAASAFYFIGRKSSNVLSDRELIRGYRGAMWSDR